MNGKNRVQTYKLRKRANAKKNTHKASGWQFKVFGPVAFVAVVASTVLLVNHFGNAQAAPTDPKVIRGQIDAITDLPQYVDGGYVASEETLGSAKNPFVILEVVPDASAASIGYLISGCEPIDVENMHLNEGLKHIDDILGTDGVVVKRTLSGTTIEGVDAPTKYFFFEDEYASDMIDSSGNAINADYRTFDMSQDAEAIYELDENGAYVLINNPQLEDGDGHPLFEDEAGVFYYENGTDYVDENGVVYYDNGSGGYEDMEGHAIAGALTAVLDKTQGDKVPVLDSNGNPTFDKVYVNGYYELVADGTGTFERTITYEENGRDVADVSIYAKKGGNLRWHSVNRGTFAYEDVKADFATKTDRYGLSLENEFLEVPNANGSVTLVEQWYVDSLAKNLENIGDRIYTTREASSVDTLAFDADNYYDYENPDNFLKDTLGLSDAEADSYCVVVKTMTPAELNAASEWIDYADLIFLNTKQASDTEYAYFDEYKTNYKTYDLSATRTFYNTDMSFANVYKMYQKISSEKDYAPVIMDDDIYVNVASHSRSQAGKYTVYDWNMNKLIGGTTYEQATGYNNNWYKLSTMLMSLPSGIFEYLYTSDNGIFSINTTNGEFKKGNEKYSFWAPEMFYAVPTADYWNNMYQYYTSEEFWDAYSATSAENFKTDAYRNYIFEHVYTYKNGTDFVKSYADAEAKNVLNSTTVGLNKYSDFESYAKSNYDVADEEAQRKLAEENGTLDQFVYVAGNQVSASEALAVRYILNLDKVNPTIETAEKTLNVLDIEPSASGSTSVNYDLKESYVHFLCPGYRGNVDINHMAVAEFNGKIEDLNSNYQMIYFGTKCSGFNTKDVTLNLNHTYSVNGVTDTPSSVTVKNVPDWNEDSTDGMVYRHTGDYIYSNEYNAASSNDRSVSFVYGVVSKDGSFISRRSSVDGSTYGIYANGTHYSYDGNLKLGNWIPKEYKNDYLIRYNGNDITSIKMNELKDFAQAGYPIVAEEYIAYQEPKIVDKYSFLYQLVGDLNVRYNTAVCTYRQSGKINDKFFSNTGDAVEFTVLPSLYDGTSNNDGVVSNPNYLPKVGGRSQLNFEFDLKDSQHSYKYNIYVDSNADSKFSDDEIIYRAGTAKLGTNRRNYNLSTKMVGLIYWQIEVYRVDNPTIRYRANGSSAAQKTGATKEKINVLQISPGSNLDLASNDKFKKLYPNLEDYQISVTTIKQSDFEALFKTQKVLNAGGFVFDMDKEISDTNPSATVRRALYENDSLYCTVNYYNGENNTTNARSIKVNLDDYNMIIVGFGDTMGGTDIDDYYGAAEWIQYYIASGKGILFTHDYTSFNNRYKDAFGTTANAFMRDIMGMNANGMVSTEINYNNVYNNNRKTSDSDSGKNSLRDSLQAYQTAKVSSDPNAYTWLYDANGNQISDAVQGYTYWGIKRIAQSNGNSKIANPSMNGDGSYNWSGASLYNLNSGLKSMYKDYGFNESNNETTKVQVLNRGMITEYPFKLSDELSVAPTHAQYFLLNLEDPNVTCWYTLKSVNNNEFNVSPNDGANNYYIYSKENVFYSGVGHTSSVSDYTGDEAKLFINTIIAAFRAGYEAPEVQVTNPEAVSNADGQYSIELMQEYNNGVTREDGLNQQVAVEASEEYKVLFTPIEYNTRASVMYVTISYPLAYDGDGKVTSSEYIDKVYDAETGTVHTASADHVFTTLDNSHEYYFMYPQKYLDNWTDDAGVIQNPRRKVIFRSHNNLDKEKYNENILTMSVEPLFQLD